MSATKSYSEGVLVMGEELTQQDGIAIAATTGNWNSRRWNGHIIGFVGRQLLQGSADAGCRAARWESAQVARYSLIERLKNVLL